MKTFSYPRDRVYARDWIVIQGNLLNSTRDGGFEFFGPFTEAEAIKVRDDMKSEGGTPDLTICVQLLKLPNVLGEHWNPRQRPQYYGEDL